MSGTAAPPTPKQTSLWSTPDEPIVIGKDILELLSNSMYVDAMSIYREYVQNSADAVDAARAAGILKPHERGHVAIEIDTDDRSVKIRDNGIGVLAHEFISKLTAFGASSKRGTGARGFRGVGRLAGMGYCQQVVFRSRAVGERKVNELRWDCRKVKSMLRSTDFSGHLTDLVRETVSARSIVDENAPEHFFEVELLGIIRHKNDSLLDGHAISGYLAQVAPVPFSPNFAYQEQIESRLANHIPLGNLQIEISGLSDPVYRPHRDEFEIRLGLTDRFSEIEFVEIPNDDNTLAVVGWILHHGYFGAIPPRAGVGGLRFRSGNIQVGNSAILEDIFPESRFNSWSVGEFHVIDPKLMPNGRRDHFEQNVPFFGVLNSIGPLARAITSRARISSVRRKCLRDLDLQKQSVQEKLGIIKQGSLSRVDRERFAHEIRKSIDLMERLAQRNLLTAEEQKSAERTIGKIRTDLENALEGGSFSPSLAKLSRGKRETYQHCFKVIYECVSNEATAKSIIDKILRRIR